MPFNAFAFFPCLQRRFPVEPFDHHGARAARRARHAHGPARPARLADRGAASCRCRAHPSLGVLGMGELASGESLLQTAFMLLGIAFLLVYGAQAFARFRAGASTGSGALHEAGNASMTRRQATPP